MASPMKNQNSELWLNQEISTTPIDLKLTSYFKASFEIAESKIMKDLFSMFEKNIHRAKNSVMMTGSNGFS
jgi:hypothetical protein